MQLQKKIILSVLCFAALNQGAEASSHQQAAVAESKSSTLAAKAEAMREKKEAIPGKQAQADELAQKLGTAKVDLAATSKLLKKTTENIVDSQEVQEAQLNDFLKEATKKLETITKEELLKKNHIEQIKFIVERYEQLLGTLVKEVKTLQLQAFKDEEEIARLKIQRDMMNDRIDMTQVFATIMPNSTTKKSIGTQTDKNTPGNGRGNTPPRTGSPDSGIGSRDGGAIPSHSPGGNHHVSPPQDTNAAFNRFVGGTGPLTDWEEENKEYRAAMAKGEHRSLAPEKRHIHRCWVAARLIKAWNNDTSKIEDIKTMHTFMLGKHKPTTLPDLRSSNSCFQHDAKYKEVSNWMKQNDILFGDAEKQIMAHSPPRRTQRSTPPDRLKVGDPALSSPSPVRPSSAEVATK